MDNSFSRYSDKEGDCYINYTSRHIQGGQKLGLQYWVLGSISNEFM
jgi:hypothetical protein